MITTLSAIAMGGALGALARFGLVALVQMTLMTRYPAGTLLVNSVGSFLAGLLMVFFMSRVSGGDAWRLFFVVGFLGAFTTFSSYAWETLALYHDRMAFAALMNIILNNLSAILLALLGMQLGRWLERGI